jgi:hypothetical protein
MAPVANWIFVGRSTVSTRVFFQSTMEAQRPQNEDNGALKTLALPVPNSLNLGDAGHVIVVQRLTRRQSERPQK